MSNNELDELFSVKDLQELFGNEAMFKINGIKKTHLRKPKLKTVGINTEQQHDIQQELIVNEQQHDIQQEPIVNEQQHDIQQEPIVNEQQHDIHQQPIVNAFRFEMPPSRSDIQLRHRREKIFTTTSLDAIIVDDLPSDVIVIE
ncbi:hypothetical protein ACF0H5_008868 [Mactra antiquata]